LNESLLSLQQHLVCLYDTFSYLKRKIYQVSYMCVLVNLWHKSYNLVQIQHKSKVLTPTKSWQRKRCLIWKQWFGHI
jgi:hypothetical protein